MNQFYETYSDDEKLATLVQELPCSLNLTIFGRCNSREEREFYLRAASGNKWSKRELDRQINVAQFERAMLGPKLMLTKEDNL